MSVERSTPLNLVYLRWGYSTLSVRYNCGSMVNSKSQFAGLVQCFLSICIPVCTEHCWCGGALFHPDNLQMPGMCNLCLQMS